MEELFQVMSKFLWTLGQAFFVGSLAGMSAVIGVTMFLAAIGMWRFPTDPRPRKSLVLLGFLPLFWIFLGFWGAIFNYSWGSGEPKNPEWMSNLVVAVSALYLVTWIAFLILLREARVVTLVFGIWNLYLVAVTGLIALMSLSGSWI